MESTSTFHIVYLSGVPKYIPRNQYLLYPTLQFTRWGKANQESHEQRTSHSGSFQDDPHIGIKSWRGFFHLSVALIPTGL